MLRYPFIWIFVSCHKNIINIIIFIKVYNLNKNVFLENITLVLLYLIIIIVTFMDLWLKVSRKSLTHFTNFILITAVMLKWLVGIMSNWFSIKVSQLFALNSIDKSESIIKWKNSFHLIEYNFSFLGFLKELTSVGEHFDISDICNYNNRDSVVTKAKKVLIRFKSCFMPISIYLEGKLRTNE